MKNLIKKYSNTFLMTLVVTITLMLFHFAAGAQEAAVRCKSITKANTQCTRKAVKGKEGMCTQHYKMAHPEVQWATQTPPKK